MRLSSPMRFSSRVPANFSPNDLARHLAERRAAGLEILDLTETNPTRVGLPGPSPEALAILSRAAGEPYAPEPLGDAAARAALAADLAARGVTVSPEQIVLTSGTSESYAHLFRVLAEPGECLLAPEPSYPLFAPLAALEGVRLVPYRLAYDGAGWRLDRESFETALAHAPRGVLVVQPNNPTGSLLSAAENEYLALSCEARGLTLISDEVFGDFTTGERASLAGEERALTVVLDGLSKSCGAPQLKAAWMVIGGPADPVTQLRARLEWSCDAFLSVAQPVQAALPELLRGRAPYVAAVRERLRVNLAALDAAGLERLAWQGGWSAVLRLPHGRDEESWLAAFLDAGVLAHPGHFFDFEEEPIAVVSLLPEPEHFARALARLVEVIDAR